MPDLPPFDQELFFIGPIGAEETDDRQRNDDVYKFIVQQAASELGLTAVRADKIGVPGNISVQVVEHVLESAVVVADLTGRNANVYYELGLRHAARRPVVLISEDDELPFDIAQLRTVFFNIRNLNSVQNCVLDVVAQVTAARQGSSYSPVNTALALASFNQGDALERTLSDILSAIETMSSRLHALTPPGSHPGPENIARFGRTVEETRVAGGLSVEEVCKRARINRSMLEKIERGEWEPSLMTILALAEALRMDPADLVEAAHDGHDLDGDSGDDADSGDDGDDDQADS